jgi:hypothetical protein
MPHNLCVAWIDEVLAPYVASVPKRIVPLLLLDQYKCHLMASIVNRIEALGVQVEHIPSGYTGLVQPVDVGIGKPLKNRMRHQWEEFMIDEGMKTSFTKPPSRKLVAQWVQCALDALPQDIVKNAWRHAPYSYYPHQLSTGAVARAAAAGGNTETNDSLLEDEDNGAQLFLPTGEEDAPTASI